MQRMTSCSWAHVKPRDEDSSLAPERARPLMHRCLNRSPSYPEKSAKPAEAVALGCADISDSFFYARGE